LPLIEAVGTSAGWGGWPGAAAYCLKPHIFVDSFDAALNMAFHGNGVALVSEVLAHSTLASGQLVRAHVDGRPCEEGYYVRADEKNSAALQFRDWIFELVQSANPRN
jgi:DNA-binding transcriptional LysR family regulator